MSVNLGKLDMIVMLLFIRLRDASNRRNGYLDPEVPRTINGQDISFLPTLLFDEMLGLNTEMLFKRHSSS